MASRLLSQSALDRYRAFAAAFPALLPCLEQQHVAVYIGVTPESLSRLLREEATGTFTVAATHLTATPPTRGVAVGALLLAFHWVGLSVMGASYNPVQSLTTALVMRGEAWGRPVALRGRSAGWGRSRGFLYEANAAVRGKSANP